MSRKEILLFIGVGVLLFFFFRKKGTGGTVGKLADKIGQIGSNITFGTFDDALTKPNARKYEQLAIKASTKCEDSAFPSEDCLFVTRYLKSIGL